MVVSLIRCVCVRVHACMRACVHARARVCTMMLTFKRLLFFLPANTDDSTRWPFSLRAAPPVYPSVPGPQLNVTSIDSVRRWITKRPEVLSSIVMLLREDHPLLLERVCATLANIALFAPSIPFILRQTVNTKDSDDMSKALLAQEHVEALRQQQEDLLLEEIRLRERMRDRNSQDDKGGGSASSYGAGTDSTWGAAAEADMLLLSEIDKRREVITQRLQDLAFEREFTQINSRVPLVTLLSRLVTMHDQPSRARSARSQAQRLLLNLR